MRSLLRRIFRTPDSRAYGAAVRPRVRIDARHRVLYAIGDVHGCFDALQALEARIVADAGGRRAEKPLIVYLGDYVDRGPQSRDVLSHLARNDHNDGIARIALCGNHDDAFLRFIRDPVENTAWLDYGGDATLRSYGLGNMAHQRRPEALLDVGRALAEAVPQAHIDLLENLPVYAQSGDRLFVHAGIRPGIPLDDQADEDLLWIREPFLNEGPRLPITVVHGHTAGVEPVFGDGRICIDTGCYATGRLTALRVTATQTVVL